jgi:hypothetical protein
VKRGRKPTPCPNYDEVRRLAAIDPRPTIVARELGVGIKAARRWLLEVGIHVKPSHKQRPRGAGLHYLKVGLTPNGRRIWTKLYGVWNAMRGRCNSPGTKDYKRYGARGIRVCAEWGHYGKFRAWALKNGYRKGLTLDRMESDGNYEPDNCRWISKGEQQANIRRAIMLTLNDETRSLYRWARIVGMSADLLRTRHYSGWTDEQVLTTPILPNGVYRRGVQHKPRGRKRRIEVSPSEDA